MTPPSAVARHAATSTRTSSRPRRERLEDWMDEDHLISHAVIVPIGLAGLAGLLALGYALLFLT